MNKLDILKRTILRLDAFMLKQGQDMGLRKDVIDGINQFTGENSLSTIYINTADSTQVPYVFVMPKYNKDFNKFIMNADLDYHMPWGYTLELSRMAFTKFTSEELMALILHAITQNVMSSSAKIRFLNAYSTFPKTVIFSNRANSAMIRFWMHLRICLIRKFATLHFLISV